MSIILVTPPISRLQRKIKTAVRGGLVARIVKRNINRLSNSFFPFCRFFVWLIVASDNTVLCKSDHLTGYFKQVSCTAAILVKIPMIKGDFTLLFLLT